MKLSVNKPSESKINITSLLGVLFNAFLTLAVVYNIIPEEAVVPITTIVNTGLLLLIVVWRTWFTNPEEPDEWKMEGQ